MTQHDYVIDNDTAADVRSDLNDAFQAIVSLNSGASEPSTTYANMLWYDETNDILKMRNQGNDAWITVFTVDQLNDLAEAALSAKMQSIDDQANASGDIIYYDGSDFVRLPIGSNGNRLEVSSGAPSWTSGTVADSDLSTTATNDGRDWVRNRLALIAAGSIGSPGFMFYTGAGGNPTSVGTARNGSGLRWSNAGSNSSGTPSGTWRIFGYGTTGGGGNNTSFWLRVL